MTPHPPTPGSPQQGPLPQYQLLPPPGTAMERAEDITTDLKVSKGSMVPTGYSRGHYISDRNCGGNIF